MSATVQSFQDLIVWQRAMDLSEVVYKLSATLPREERYGLSSQMQRASVSIPANIAEGWGRQSTGDYIRFLKIAQGSAAELETELILSVRLGLLPSDKTAPARATLSEIRKMLRALIASLQRKRAGFVALSSLPLLSGLALALHILL